MCFHKTFCAPSAESVLCICKRDVYNDMDLLCHHGNCDVARTSHAANGKEFDVFIVFLSVMLLHNRICANGIIAKPFELLILISLDM